MKIAAVTCQKSLPDAELLVRFIMRRLSEIEPDHEPPPVLIALALAVGFREKRFHDPLREQISSSSDNAETILKMYKDLFMPALWGQILDGSDMDEENPFPGEGGCQRVLQYALVEGTRLLAERDFQFLDIFRFLTRTGLSLYSFRLWQFESACTSFQDDPASIVREGIEIIRTALGSPQDYK